MKKMIFVFAISFLFTIHSFASTAPKTVRSVKQSSVVSLLEGVKSENSGLRSGAAYLLGELQSDEAVLPLMDMFNSSDVRGERIAAALALTKIGDERGIRVLEFASKHDADPVVKNLCEKFYKSLMYSNSVN